MKSLIIIPIKNAYDNILEILTKIETAAPGIDYLVIDMGSTDRTKHLLRNNDINRLEMAIEVNYLSALALGIKYAYDNKYDNCMQLDQNDFLEYENIKYFIRTMKHSKADIVQGSRFIEKKMPWSMRFWGAHFLRFITRLILGKKRLTDPYLRYRMINKKVMKEVIDNPEWSLDADTVVKLIKAGYKNTEIQVTLNNSEERQSGRKRIELIRYIWFKTISILFVQPFRRVKGSK